MCMSSSEGSDMITAMVRGQNSCFFMQELWKGGTHKMGKGARVLLVN